MQSQKKDKNSLLFILVVIIFIILLFIWRVVLKFIPRNVNQKENTIFSELINQGDQIKTEFGKNIPQIINNKLLQVNDLEKEETVPELTNAEVKKIEEKILEHINQKNSD